MSRLHEPLQQHIHDALISECNNMSIRIKVWSDRIIENQSKEQKEKILKIREHHTKPTEEEILSLIDRCRDEMNQCTKPFKRYWSMTPSTQERLTIATEIAKAIVQNPSVMKGKRAGVHTESTPENIAEYALKITDELIRQLKWNQIHKRGRTTSARK